MEIKELESKLNDFVVSIGVYDNFIFKQLSFFYTLSYHLGKTLNKYFKDYKSSINYSKITKITLFDKINFVKDFFRNVGINFDIDKHINDGTINFENYDFFYDNEDIERKKSLNFTKGYNILYSNGKNNVNICNNGLITDIPVFVHEISHLRNQINSGRTETGDLLTETLAITDEFICCDYLKEKGYINEANIIFEERFDHLYNITAKMNSIYKMLLLFDKLGSISKENYKYYYGEDFSYDYNLKILKSYDFNKCFIYNTRYVLATALAPYLYCKYKEDNSFMKNIIDLHEFINKNDMISCFKKMDINKFDLNEIKNMLDCIDKIMFDINNVKTL